jgi:hypothetical protein
MELQPTHRCLAQGLSVLTIVAGGLFTVVALVRFTVEGRPVPEQACEMRR